MTVAIICCAFIVALLVADVAARAIAAWSVRESKRWKNAIEEMQKWR